MRQRGLCIAKCFGSVKGLGSLALHHITKQGPGRAGKSDKRNPAGERFYGDNNDRMPAFGPHDNPQLNQLDDKSLGLIVDWLRGDWVRVSEPVEKFDEAP